MSLRLSDTLDPISAEWCREKWWLRCADSLNMKCCSTLIWFYILSFFNATFKLFYFICLLCPSVSIFIFCNEKEINFLSQPLTKGFSWKTDMTWSHLLAHQKEMKLHLKSPLAAQSGCHLSPAENQCGDRYYPVIFKTTSTFQSMSCDKSFCHVYAIPHLHLC